jgi:threonyl-tRNA synthetase
MKLLIWHCSKLASRDVRRSSRPRGISESVDAPRSESFVDVLAAFACVESGDDEQSVEAAAREIAKLGRQVHCRDVVIVPFAHLSRDLMTDSRRAAGMLERIAGELKRDGWQTAVNSFGYHKEFELHFVAKGHPGAVAYREV